MGSEEAHSIEQLEIFLPVAVAITASFRSSGTASVLCLRTLSMISIGQTAEKVKLLPKDKYRTAHNALAQKRNKTDKNFNVLLSTQN